MPLRGFWRLSVERVATSDGPFDYSGAAAEVASIALMAGVSFEQRLGLWRAGLPIELTPTFAETIHAAIERALSAERELAILWFEAAGIDTYADTILKS